MSKNKLKLHQIGDLAGNLFYVSERREYASMRLGGVYAMSGTYITNGTRVVLLTSDSSWRTATVFCLDSQTVEIVPRMDLKIVATVIETDDEI